MDIHSPMAWALSCARRSSSVGEIPVGAVITQAGTLISVAHNLSRTQCDPTAHAEIVAIRAAAQFLKRRLLDDCDLYVTLEPCAMCAQAIAHARIRRLYYAAADPKGGGVEHGARIFNQKTCHHRPEIYAGIGEQQASILMKQFFQERR